MFNSLTNYLFGGEPVEGEPSSTCSTSTTGLKKKETKKRRTSAKTEAKTPAKTAAKTPVKTAAKTPAKTAAKTASETDWTIVDRSRSPSWESGTLTPRKSRSANISSRASSKTSVTCGETSRETSRSRSPKRKKKSLSAKNRTPSKGRPAKKASAPKLSITWPSSEDEDEDVKQEPKNAVAKRSPSKKRSCEKLGKNATKQLILAPHAKKQQQTAEEKRRAKKAAARGQLKRANQCKYVKSRSRSKRPFKPDPRTTKTKKVAHGAMKKQKTTH